MQDARGDDRAGIHRFFALKVTHAHLLHDPTFRDMFADEVSIVSQIRHANVCQAFDFNAAADQYYIAMEYLMGHSLMEVLRTLSKRPEADPLRASRLVARALSEACEGLRAAHELRGLDGAPLGVVHRDVSPENVFLTYDGVAKVVDFGVASTIAQRHSTRSGVVKGKVCYLAPESLLGSKAHRRVDVWGIGVIAWELLTGRRLFCRETDAETLAAIGEAPIPAPSSVRSGIPRELDAVVLRALAREPEQRHATARELGRELASAAASVSTADLSEWMDDLFPEGRERSRRLVEIAAEILPSGEHDAVSFAPPSMDATSMAAQSPPASSHTTPPNAAVARMPSIDLAPLLQDLRSHGGTYVLQVGGDGTSIAIRLEPAPPVYEAWAISIQV